MKISPSDVIRRIVRKDGKIVTDEKPPTPEERKAMEKEYERTHPPYVERVSGCC